MKSVTSDCDPTRLDLYLHGELSTADEQHLATHLDGCSECRHALEQRAADAGSWEEARQFLQPMATELELGASGFSVQAMATRVQPLQIRSVIDALGPTDDPQMLGRLGTYEVSGVIGSGGMGVVLKAFDKSLDRTVAIKVLAPHLASSGAARQRFAREAKAAAAVLHSNVMAIHSVSNDETLPYLVMPYVRGTTLQKRLDEEGALPTSEVLRIGSQIAAGLAAAHAQGIVHRDIKPANILLEEGVERVAITDFGLARAVDDATMTRSGVIAGTPQYMSPEQARGEALSQHSDLFSLGSVMYAMCTGRPPFRAETSFGVLRRITDQEPKSIREINSDVPEWLCRIISKLMSKQADDRFESAGQVATLLEDCLAHTQQPAQVPLPPVCAQILGKPRASTAYAAAIRRYGLTVVAAGMALGSSALALFLWLSADSPDIAGKWTGDGWGRVELSAVQDGQYTGTYSDTFGKRDGTIELEWSRVEHRYKGTWREGNQRFGKIAVRLVNGELRGAWTTSKKAELNPGVPQLADLLWKRLPGESTKWPTPATGDPAAADIGMATIGRPTNTIPLVDAVRAFNERYREHPLGLDQPPLTDDEVVASLRWELDVAKKAELTADDQQQLRDMAERRVFDTNWRFELETELQGDQQQRFQSWTIRLTRPNPDGNDVTHLLRQRLLRQVGAADNSTIEPGAVDKSAPDDAMPLAAAIHGFNEQHSSLGGQPQPPLTMDEVIAAIRWWRTQRDEAPVTNGEFQQFQRIADTRQLPANARFELIGNFRPADGSDFLIWSVRIVLPRESKPGWTYAYLIRQQFVRSKRLDEDQIAWGKAAANGLQVGVRLDPRNEQYTAGQRVVPMFYFRNAGSSTLNASFPRLMTHSYYELIIAVDASGRGIPIEQDPEPGGPVGWIQLPLEPGATHEIRGFPVVLGDVERGTAETAIRAQPGQSLRIRYVVANYAETTLPHLETGNVLVDMAK